MFPYFEDGYGANTPYYGGPIEDMAFSAHAMSEARRDRLHDLARKMADNAGDYSISDLTPSEAEFVLKQCYELRNNKDNYKWR